MDNDKIERIIELVRSRVYLYDTSHPQFKNASLKAEVWESIGAEINETGIAVKNKWRTVRDGYAKHKKQVKESASTGAPYIWGSRLAFLDKYNSSKSRKIRKTDANTDITNASDSHNTMSMSTTDNDQRHRKRPLQNNGSDDDGIERIIKYFEEKQNERKLDVIDNLFLTYADTFKKFPQREQAMVKLELAKLFSDFELRLCNNTENSNTAEVPVYVNDSAESLISQNSIRFIKEEEDY